MTQDINIRPFTKTQTTEILRKCGMTRPELDQKTLSSLLTKACKISSVLILYIKICFTQIEKAD